MQTKHENIEELKMLELELEKRKAKKYEVKVCLERCLQYTRDRRYKPTSRLRLCLDAINSALHILETTKVDDPPKTA